jgi:hypothetical protein
MSFKLGAEERLAAGRLFVDHTEETLRNSLTELPIDFRDTWISDDVRPNRIGERWVNSIVSAPCPKADV